jgi:hypothetical protein
MTSKAEKLRQHRVRQRLSAGRPRKPGERYPSGDLKRAETENDVKSVAIAAIARIHGIKTDGKDGFSGYTLGRMFLDGKISRPELEAGNRYAEIMARYHKSVGLPLPSVRAQNLFAVRGHDGDVSETAHIRAKKSAALMMRIETMLLRLDHGPQIKRMVRNICFEDIEHLRMIEGTQLQWLISGLRAIHFELGLQVN